MKYRVIDWYEGREVLYKGEDLKAAKKARRERYDDTDGEADVTIEEQHIVFDEETQTERKVWQLYNVKRMR